MKPSPTAAKRYHAVILEAAGAGIDTHGIAAALGVTPGCVHHRTAELRRDGLILAATQDAGPKPVRWFAIEHAADAATYQYPHTTSVRRRKERVKAPPQPPKDLHAPWLEVLSAAGETGTTSALGGAALGFHPQTAAIRLGELVNRGLAVSRHEAGERAGSRLRYWLAGCEPLATPKMPKAPRLEQDAPAILTGRERHVVGPANRDFRFTVKRLPDGYVSQLDARQCRPWAEAAAGGGI